MQEKETPGSEMRGEYQRQMLAIRDAFESGASGAATIAARAQAMDELIIGLWAEAVEKTPGLKSGIALLALGGYGRSELFPYSDVDLMYLLDTKISEQDVKQPIRRMSQELWDCGIRLSPLTRKRNEAERFDPDNVEFALSSLDHRFLAGDAAVYERFAGIGLPKLLERESKAIADGLVELTAERHKKYGDTLFHLEPSIKDCPGGLRDVHVCAWLTTLAEIASGTKQGRAERGSSNGSAMGDRDEFNQAVEFLFTVRCFLHYRHERDDNTLDWQAQDAAAKAWMGLDRRRTSRDGQADAAYWMRLYFRHARIVERSLTHMLEAVPLKQRPARWTVPGKAAFARRRPEPPAVGYRVENGRAVLSEMGAPGDPAQDPEVVLQLFAAMSRTGCALDQASEQRMTQSLPLLSAHLEEGPALWRHLQAILLGPHAGKALRAMHALGILELLIPEFHGIDALVIRDAYHRYTVDEHTMVVIDTLHGLETPQEGAMGEWAGRFRGILRDVQHQALLYLAALMHDTGKGRSTDDHARESARMAESVAGRLELDAYESELLLGLIRNHLEMSAALRRDIFDLETVRAFAGKM
ncbi:MAG TPA: HD domain-containing protein, partial [Acidobacteriaceae bacterium]